MSVTEANHPLKPATQLQKVLQTHSMTTKQEGQVALYDDAEDASNPHEVTVLPTTPSSNSTVDLYGETAAEYSKETATQRYLTQLQEHFE